ncbi:vegetative cell wall protein gp1-like [Setaria italica]|uniref:vegetative cell wall protein gp1-like n=1 Tax=Setaria italica TaxID=4555 RepID=UPI000350C9E0|nr:vegetative cell wall protein gp1-like [Setaria italica]
MAVAAAAAPPLLPTPTARSLPATLLPTPPPTGHLIPSPASSAPPNHRLSPSPAYIPPCRRLAVCSPDPPAPAVPHLAPSPTLAMPSTRTSPTPPIHALLAAYVPPCRRLAACSLDSTAPPIHASSAASPAVIPTPPLTPRLIGSPASPAPTIHCLPPSLVYVPPSRRLAACSPDSPAPSAPRLAPSPAPAAPSASNPGRASTSKSWFRDKAACADLALPSSPERNANLALPSSPERIKGFKVPGRASLSCVKDRVAGSDVLANSGCLKRNLTSPADNIGKKMRYESPSLSEDSGSDSEPEFYAGPAFRNAPPASSLPIPISLMMRRNKFIAPALNGLAF